ncbi:MAG: efflux transporter outer membrane subunit [Burkholderiaceae bacterium]|jgi:NodT family efflux transporter outer membrane factor (OMF) lipoprotein|nr:efflux transporter outer membrane subunit [Burkholderiaceae bacterium]
MKIQPTLVALAVAALCSACTTVGPDYKTPALASDAPTSYALRHAGSPLLAAPSGADAAALPADPWGALGGETLKALQQRARERNADIANAALRLAQARTQRDVAASQAGPTLGLDGSVARQRQSVTDASTRILEIFPPASQQEALDILGAPYTLYQAGFDASWELDLWGRVRRSVEAAEADDDSAAALLADVRSSIDAEVARAWLDLGAARQQIAVLQRQRASAAELLALLAARQRHGLADASPALRQQAVVDDLAARLPPLLEAEAGAWRRIELLCGDMPGDLAAQLGTPQAVPPAAQWPALALGLPSTLAARRPDIAAAAAQLHAATATVGVAVADLYPRVMLGAGYASVSVGSSAFGSGPSQQWWFGASLDLPLFDGGRRRAAITQRELQMQQAAVTFRQTVVGAWHDVDAAIARYQAERRRSDELQRKLAASDEAFALAQVRFERGLSDETPLLETERTRLEAEREAIVSHAQQGLALVAVYKALRVEGG